MRIISGSHKGRIIKPPAGLKLRPTTDMAREGLFNILNNISDYSELRVLDLFSGTGSLSYEFASRGAQLVHAVELNSKHASFIRDTALKLDMRCIKVFRADARNYIRSTSKTYNLVFADPPYDLPWLEDIPSLVFSNNCLEPGGLFILEHPATYSFSGNEYFSKNRKYGSVNFTFFQSPNP
ncbi:MAG: RsmD family RNA methyltransferase [Bacteroidales bacterium]|nr:RsmD family RNA methyltransferase [Bacteroidales bacterium]